MRLLELLQADGRLSFKEPADVVQGLSERKVMVPSTANCGLRWCSRRSSKGGRCSHRRTASCGRRPRKAGR